MGAAAGRKPEESDETARPAHGDVRDGVSDGTIWRRGVDGSTVVHFPTLAEAEFVRQTLSEFFGT